jgi:hypothetical protein
MILATLLVLSTAVLSGSPIAIPEDKQPEVVVKIRNQKGQTISVALPPIRITVTVTWEPRDEYRRLKIILADRYGEIEDESEMTFDGANTQSMVTRKYDISRQGYYHVLAGLFGSDGKLIAQGQATLDAASNEPANDSKKRSRKNRNSSRRNR